MSTLSAPRILRGTQIEVPKILYGTAWKKDQTADLTYKALKAGFKGVDTAAQPRHYIESLAAEGLNKAIRDGIVKRDDIYIQTKFTPAEFQDVGNMPYDPNLPIPEQVHVSVASSLKNLTTPDHPFIDCLVLHDPYEDDEDTLTCWRTLQTYVPGKIKCLGISNAPLGIVRTLNETCKFTPVIVQNPFSRATQWDVSLRKYCRDQGILFQSFWTLTNNKEQLTIKPVIALAKELATLGVGDPHVVALYSLIIGLGNVSVLCGTTNEQRMNGDVDGLDIVTEWAEGRGKQRWEELLAEYKTMIGEEA